MFGKSDLVDNLSRDLSRARDKRDALASDVTTLSAQISELEARLSAENDRRERERVEGEIEGIKERLKDFYLMFAKAIVGMRDASVAARAIVPEATELSDLLIGFASEIVSTVDNLLGDLDRRLEALRTPQLPQPLDGSPGLPQDNDRVLRRPEWLPRRKATKEDSVEDQCSTAAAIEVIECDLAGAAASTDEKLNEELRAVLEEVKNGEPSLEGCG
jgi:hypothetical protein